MSQADDILEIQMLGQRYADAVIRHDADDWGACWSREGEWQLPGMKEPVKGRETIVKTWTGAMSGLPFAFFKVLPAIVTVNGDTAESRNYVEEILEDKEGNGRRVFGVYNDDLVREDGTWKFKRRTYNVLYSDSMDLPGQKTDYTG